MTGKIELFKFTRYTMILSGIWRLEINASRWVRRLYITYSIATQIIFDISIFMFNMEFAHLFRVDIEQAIENLSRMIFVLLLIAKFSICQTKGMQVLIKQALDGETKIIATDNSKIRSIYEMHAWYCQVLIVSITVASFVLSAYLSEIGIEESYKFHREPRSLNESREDPFPVALWYPFNRNKYFIVVMCHQTLEICLTGFYSTAVNAITNSVLIYMRARLKILQHNLENFATHRTENCAKGGDHALYSLKMFSKLHQELIQWTVELNGNFKHLIFLEYGVSSLLLAAVIFQIFAGIKVVFNYIYFGLISCQLMALAWNANEVAIESENLATALYNSKWYHESLQTRVILQIMMVRCQRQLTISIGPFGALNTEAVLSRFKLAYSYVSVMSSGSV
ncbi:odorant receptor 82a-like [Cylas formicarius]|uniref:odorant receptor 82a-like n=1 Tax=Cylas formicarius TaxID=197179 RepID=UPI002958B5FE|nr:odorant receptor 82a-like [Cylas formicarius]